MAKPIHLKRPKATKGHDRKQPDADLSSECTVQHGCDLAMLGVFFSSLAVYISTTYPSIPGGDSGELVTAACELGVAHPPGYPTWTLLSAVAIRLLPFSPAYSVNILNCFISALASSMLFLLCYRLTEHLVASLISVVIFSLSPLVWTWSVTGEVFALNNLFILLLLYTYLKFEFSSDEQQRFQSVCLGAFLSGLALTNQHTAILFIVVIVIRVFYQLRKLGELSSRVVLSVPIYGLIGLLPYIYLPISSYINTARWSWGEHTTFSGFFTHLIREEYGSFDLGKDQEGQGLIPNLLQYKLSLINELTILGYSLGCLGIVQTFMDLQESVRRFSEAMLSMLSLYVLFFCWRANLDVTNDLFRGVVERFWLQPLILWAILISLGVRLIFMRLELRRYVPLLMQLVVVALLAAALISRSLASCNHRYDTMVDDFANTMIDSLPSDALVLTRGDLPSSTLRYKQLCEERRTDLSLVEQELMSYEWYVPKLKNNIAGVVFPGDYWFHTTGTTQEGYKVFNMETFLDTNMKNNRTAFVCIGMQQKDNSWKKKYTMLPYGSCHQLVRSSEDWVEYTKPYSIDWYQTYTRLPKGTWESVANEEMWASKINKAMFLWGQSQSTSDPEQRNELYQAIYVIYEQIIAQHDKVPPYIHKNYALACEKVARLPENTPDQIYIFLSDSVKHFRLYMDQVSLEEDPQIANIKLAIDDMSQQLSKMKLR